MPVAGLLEDRQRLLVAVNGLLKPPQLPVGQAEIAQGPAFTDPVAGLPPDGQRILVAADGLLEPPQRPVGLAEIVQGRALAMPVAGLPKVASDRW